jgi:hypothetical protein
MSSLVPAQPTAPSYFARSHIDRRIACAGVGDPGRQTRHASGNHAAARQAEIDLVERLSLGDVRRLTPLRTVAACPYSESDVAGYDLADLQPVAGRGEGAVRFGSRPSLSVVAVLFVRRNVGRAGADLRAP